MQEVEIIKADKNRSDRKRGKYIERMRVAAYCRVSTNTEDQLNSYKSQVKYYTDLIKNNKDWVLVDIYADEAITGTMVKNRGEFQRLINDCMKGNVDMIITKSVSRFARNTLDTLKYVRMLKKQNVAVVFEDEKINTLSMDGELLLVVLSSVAQQEVENTSANVKKGLKMKMKRGEMVGFNGCLGYEYNPEDKTITINEEEAEIVRYVFKRYIEGAGCTIIANELTNLGYKTKKDASRWSISTILSIIKNEKYKGDLLQEKTYTVDPIYKTRRVNYGEEDQFYIRDHHEPIVDKEVFEEAQRILQRRNVTRRNLAESVKREKFSRMYAFSCLLECGFCGSLLSRRSWNSGTKYNKVVWQCVTATKKGKYLCPESSGIPERIIESAFVDSFCMICKNQEDVIQEFLKRVSDNLNIKDIEKQLNGKEKEIYTTEQKMKGLLDLRLDENISEHYFKQENGELTKKLERLLEERQKLQKSFDRETSTQIRMNEIEKTIRQSRILEKFDRRIFESITEKVIVGGVDANGEKNPFLLKFIYKTGIIDEFDGELYKSSIEKDIKKCSYSRHEVNSACSYSRYDAR